MSYNYHYVKLWVRHAPYRPVKDDACHQSSLGKTPPSALGVVGLPVRTACEWPLALILTNGGILSKTELVSTRLSVLSDPR